MAWADFIFGSVCSGIEAASVAWEPLGWRASFLSEIEAFPRAVLSHHYPDVPLHGDFTTIEANQYEPIDLLVGGTPCQSFSVAGLRGGLDDDRGNLALEYLRLAKRLKPRWCVWENVPGVLSSNGGRDFGAILGGLVELGYGFAYRVLDAQYVRVDGFGRAVPQRRRRVFVVGYIGDWRRAAAVLFERESLHGHTAPRRTAGEGSTYRVAPCLAASGRGFDRTGDTRGQDCLVPEVSGTLRVNRPGETGQASTLNAAGQMHAAIGYRVRRLTPTECERLQGFPDGYTNIPYRNRNDAPDGPRYKALGNSMAVNVMRWIGTRIQMVEQLGLAAIEEAA